MQTQSNLSTTSAIKFVLLLGILSFFSDMVYEGARSITGPFFALLGASGATVGFVAGFGEFVGNGLRVVSGYLIDRTEKYWLITFSGYACLLALPLLAFAKTWEMAAILIIIERVGKAIRTPARDAMLSYATQRMGRGVGFGIHQVFDQVGGVIDPFIFTLILLSHQNYQLGFKILLIPTCFAFVVLFFGRKLYPTPQNLEIAPAQIINEKSSFTFSKSFWIYLCAACLLAAGYADFPLIAFHFQKTSMIPPVGVPIFYMVAMGVSAFSAILFGWIYDRFGLRSLLISIPLSALYAPCVFLNGFKTALLGMIFWGIGIGAQRSLLKAVVGDIVPKNIRGSAYGIFNAGYGVAWFLGSWLMGFLYDTAIHSVVVFSVFAELAAIPFIYALMLRKKAHS
jgi:MFS family permease